MAFDMVPLDNRGMKQITAIEGEHMTQALANQFFLQTENAKGEPQIYIKKAGLFWKLDSMYPQRYRLDTENLGIENLEGYKIMRKQLGIPDSGMCIIFKSSIYIDGEKLAQAYGTVTGNNIKGNKFPLELAETRAECRVIRKILRCGFSVAEEQPEWKKEFGDPGVLETKAIERQVRQKLQVFLKNNGVQRNSALKFYSNCLGKQVTSSTELNVTEMEECIEYIRKRLQIEENKEETQKVMDRWAGKISKPKAIAQKEEEEVIEAEVIEPPAELSQEEQDLFKDDPLIEEFMEETEKKGQKEKTLVGKIENSFFELGWGEDAQKAFFADQTKKRDRQINYIADFTREEQEQLSDWLADRIKCSKEG